MDISTGRGPPSHEPTYKLAFPLTTMALLINELRRRHSTTLVSARYCAELLHKAVSRRKITCVHLARKATTTQKKREEKVITCWRSADTSFAAT